MRLPVGQVVQADRKQRKGKRAAARHVGRQRAPRAKVREGKGAARRGRGAGEEQEQLGRDEAAVLGASDMDDLAAGQETKQPQDADGHAHEDVGAAGPRLRRRIEVGGVRSSGAMRDRALTQTPLQVVEQGGSDRRGGALEHDTAHDEPGIPGTRDVAPAEGQTLDHPPDAEHRVKKGEPMASFRRSHG